MSRSLNEKQNFVLGTAAAFIEATILQPTLYWKNAAAQKLPRHLVYTINPRIIYRGTAMSIFNECQMMGLQFGITNVIQNLVRAKDSDPTKPPQLTIGQEIVSSIGGGWISAYFSSPVELVMIQQQRFGKSVFSTAGHIVNTFGFNGKGLMRGLVSTALRDSIYVSGMLVVTPRVQSYLESPDSFLASDGKGLSAVAASFYASMIGGIAAAIPSHPFDVAKTCMQGDIEQQQYTTLTRSLTTLAKDSEGGLRRLYRGCVMRTINITATVYIANECRIRLSPHLAKLNI